MAVAFHHQQDVITSDDLALPVGAKDRGGAVCFHENQRGELTLNDTAGSLKVSGGKPGQGYPAVQIGYAVRRLMPVECERLQGLPDGWTNGRADGPRYKMIGNSMAVPVLRWIGEQIARVAVIISIREAA